MNRRYAFVFALFLLCSCANNGEGIDKATQEAEAAASRAEASAKAAEIAADRAEQAAKTDEQAANAQDSVRRTEDVYGRLCTPCLVCMQGDGPATRRYWKYWAIQNAACSEAASLPVKRSK